MKRGGQVRPLLHQHRIAAIARQHFRSGSNAANDRRANEHRLDRARRGAPLEIAHRTEWRVMGFATLTALAGIGLAYLFYGGGYRAPAHAFARKFPGLVSLARDKFRIDELYGVIIIRPLQVFCRVVFQVVDRVLIDKILIGSWAFVADLAGRVFRFLQVGDVQRRREQREARSPAPEEEGVEIRVERSHGRRREQYSERRPARQGPGGRYDMD